MSTKPVVIGVPDGVVELVGGDAEGGEPVGDDDAEHIYAVYPCAGPPLIRFDDIESTWTHFAEVHVVVP
jgi:hypothetical protein